MKLAARAAELLRQSPDITAGELATALHCTIGHAHHLLASIRPQPLNGTLPHLLGEKFAADGIMVIHALRKRMSTSQVAKTATHVSGQVVLYQNIVYYLQRYHPKLTAEFVTAIFERLNEITDPCPK